MKIVSGGQTGADQAALRAAEALGLERGGWCPPGRACEGGTIPRTFPLTETPADRSPLAPDVPRSQRTEWNVRDSDATLILTPEGHTDAGTRWTRACATRLGRPVLTIDPAQPDAAAVILRWLASVRPRVLNVAGPSEASVPGIDAATYALLLRVLGCFPGLRG
jgi:Circularly permutated YpsA SLOG family